MHRTGTGMLPLVRVKLHLCTSDAIVNCLNADLMGCRAEEREKRSGSTFAFCISNLMSIGALAIEEPNLRSGSAIFEVTNNE